MTTHQSTAVPLFAIETTHNHAATHIRVTNTNKYEREPLVEYHTQISLDKPPRERKLLEKEAQEAFYSTAIFRVGWKESKFYIDYPGRWMSESAIDKATRVVVPISIWRRILYFSFHPPIAGHPDQRQMSETLQKSITDHILPKMFTW